MTGITHKALVQEVASNKPNAATAFNLPDSATAPARSFDSALASGAVVPYHATNGTEWEDGIGTFTAGTPDTLARNSILDSSTGSAIDFSAGADVTVRIVWPASIATEADLLMRSALPGGRLTLAQSNPDFIPRMALTPTTQDTSADTITVAGHGLVVGTIVRADTTSGGFTAGDILWVGNVTTDTFSLHTSRANAVAGTPKVDVTGTVPTFTAMGISGTSIWYCPFIHNLINLWNGYRWQTVEFGETEIALGTLTSDKPYDLYAYLNTGVLAFESLAWTSDTVRATEIVYTDGRKTKSGDKTRLWLGSFYTTSTTETESSARNCYLINAYNKLPHLCDVREPAATWTYSTTTLRQVNANANNKINILIPEDNWPIEVDQRSRSTNSTSTFRNILSGFGLDSTSLRYSVYNSSDASGACSNTFPAVVAAKMAINFCPIGKHYLAPLEWGNGSVDTITWAGGGYQQYIRAVLPA